VPQAQKQYDQVHFRAPSQQGGCRALCRAFLLLLLLLLIHSMAFLSRPVTLDTLGDRA
jgi:hypothetical protein